MEPLTYPVGYLWVLMLTIKQVEVCKICTRCQENRSKAMLHLSLQVHHLPFSLIYVLGCINELP